MSNKTIAKFFQFVILTASASLLGQGCATVKTGDGLHSKAPRYTAPQITGKMRSAGILESSGIAASRCQNDVFWTHNDSGHEAYIYAFNRSGDDLGTWLVENAQN